MKLFNKMRTLKIGRPKLADTELKKKSLIISSIMLVIVVALVFGGLMSLNIVPKFGNLKGNANFDIYELGEEFCLDTECFYTLTDNGNTITALAKYNLYVGYFSDDSETINVIDPNVEGYGLQRNENNGFTTGVEFSRSSYWKDSIDSYPADIDLDNEDNNIYPYLQDYKEILFNKGYDISEIRLINKQEYNELLNFNSTGGLSKIFNSFYWFGFATSNATVANSWYFDQPTVDYYETLSVRPVITITKNNLQNKKYKYYKYGEEFCIDSECFNVLEDNIDSVKAIGKYNLLVGYNYTYKEGVDDINDLLTPIDKNAEGYGLQSEKTISDEDFHEMYGVLPYAEGDDNTPGYWWDENTSDFKLIYKKNIYILGSDVSYSSSFDSNSLLYEPINNYQKYLIDISNKDSIRVTLPDIFDVLPIMHNGNFMYGNTYFTPYWYNYYAPYWLSNQSSSDQVMTSIVDDSAFLLSEQYYNVLGIRPLITISKEDIEIENKTVTTTQEARTLQSTTSEASTTKNNTTTKKKVVNKTIINSNVDTTSSTTKENIIKKLVPTTNKTTTKSRKIIITTAKIEKDGNKTIVIWWKKLLVLIILLTIGYITYKRSKK